MEGNPTTTARHIGGSVLPSSSPLILQPVETPFGTLQVRVIEDEDTHGLFEVESGELLAKHPNGFSCHVLATRMAKEARWRVEAQASYIVSCAGSVTPRLFELLGSQ